MGPLLFIYFFAMESRFVSIDKGFFFQGDRDSFVLVVLPRTLCVDTQFWKSWEASVSITLKRCFSLSLSLSRAISLETCPKTGTVSQNFLYVMLSLSHSLSHSLSLCLQLEGKSRVLIPDKKFLGKCHFPLELQPMLFLYAMNCVSQSQSSICI